jgi:mono/diheme cytochrome c family protein
MRAVWLGRLVVVLGLTVAASIGAQTAPARQTASAAPAGNAETGQKLYVSIGCWQCHGYEGQGGAAGPRLAGRLAPFAVFSIYVRRPTNQMPPYTEKVVPDTDLAHVYAFLQSRPAPPPVESIPLLQK